MKTEKPVISVDEARDFVEFLKALDKTEEIAVLDILNGVKILAEKTN